MFSARIVDHSYRAIAARLAQLESRFFVLVAENEQRIAADGLVHRRFVAAGSRIGYAHLFHFRAPLTSGDHCPFERSEANEPDAFLLVALTRELADAHHSSASHVGEPRVADVSVVLPDDCFRIRSVMLHQSVERLHHVVIADIPRRGPTTHHRPIVKLCVFGDDRVLLCREVGFRIALLLVLASLRSQRHQRCNRFCLA